MRGWLEGDFWIVAWFGWFLGEPVVHSLKWTTGAELFLDFGPVSAIPWELVVHSLKWATGAGLFLDFGPVSAFSLELVVHSTEWTTGAELFLAFALFSAVAESVSWLWGDLFERICWLVNLAPLFIYYIDK